jgi:hypothetical protein
MTMLREYIRHLLWESMKGHHNPEDPGDSGEKEKQDDLLLEPDIVMDPEKETDEQNVVANIAGVTTPLGTGPTYPAKSKRKKKKSLVQAVGDAFGGARPARDKNS